MTPSNFICPSRAAALAALETIAANTPRGTQRDALLAVKNWIHERMAPDFDDETRARIQSIYDEYFDEAAQKAVSWEIEGGEPPHGTRAQVPFLFNANTKTWELENEMPPTWTEPNPDILPQTGEYIGDQNDEE